MLTLDRVTKTYRVGAFGGGSVTAVDRVSFDAAPGEVVSLIGESGSGKSTIGRMILGLTEVSDGRLTLDGKSVRPGKDFYRRVQGVFQDPFCCYNPVFKADRVFALDPSRLPPRSTGQGVGRPHRAGGTGCAPGPRTGARPLPAPAQRRPAATPPDRPSPPARPELPGRRRDHQHARRLHPHRRPQPPGRAQGARPRRPLHHPRPLARHLPRRADRGAAPRQDRRARRHPEGVRQPAPPLHPHPPGRRAPAQHPVDPAAPVETCAFHEAGEPGSDLHETEPDHFVACAQLPDCGRTPA